MKRITQGISAFIIGVIMGIVLALLTGKAEIIKMIGIIIIVIAILYTLWHFWGKWYCKRHPEAMEEYKKQHPEKFKNKS